MSKWINKFIKRTQNETDKTDRSDDGEVVSGLSGPFRAPLFIKNSVNVLGMNTDKTDKHNNREYLSVLSGSSRRAFSDSFPPKFENSPETRPDKTDRFDPKVNMSVLSVLPKGSFGKNSFYPIEVSVLSDEYEERLAIAEHDGYQDPIQAQRIAYQDAFIAVLATLPYESAEGNWLNQKIKAAKDWLVSQGLEQPE